ncbi:MAG: F0F1 ATP synthase subunit epsilon [Halanaerobiaceae bacterium]
MPKSKIKLEIVTPEKISFSEDIDILEAPAIDGLIGILPRHAPLVTALNIGVLRIVQEEEEMLISISEGFMEVMPERINVVVRTAELPEEIDSERAENAKERAERRLENDRDDINRERATNALKRAEARLKVAAHRDRIEYQR